MRPLDQVIDATLKLIPDDFNKKAELKKHLEQIKNDFRYTAPEDGGKIQLLWYSFCSAINSECGEPDTQWKEDVASLIQGKKDYLKVLNGG